MDDLTGTADERARQLAELAELEALEREWLHRQLELTIAALAQAEDDLRVAAERREDY